MVVMGNIVIRMKGRCFTTMYAWKYQACVVKHAAVVGVTEYK